MKNYEYNGNTKRTKIVTDKDGSVIAQQEELVVDWTEQDVKSLQNIMELKVGLKFKKIYNDKNPNNIEFCEVRGIVDAEIIVLWCEKDATPMREKREFYSTIDKDEFNFFVEKGVYLPLE